MAETMEEMTERFNRESAELMEDILTWAEANRENINRQYDNIQANTLHMIERLRHGDKEEGEDTHSRR